jgi:Fic family protein
VGRLIPNPHLFIAPYLKREAVYSSRIEGTQSNLERLCLEEASPTRTPDEDLREVQNYVTALEYGVKRVLSRECYLEAHRRRYYDLLQGMRTDAIWTEWLVFFLDGVEQSARMAIQRASDVLDLRERLRHDLRAKPRGSRPAGRVVPQPVHHDRPGR